MRSSGFVSGLRTLAIGGVFLSGLSFTAIEAQAAPFQTYGFSGNSGTFAVSCSGPGDGGLPNNGVFDNRNFFKAGADCTSNPLTSSASSSFSLGNVSASGSTSVSLGSINGTASMSSDAQNAVPFPAGFTDAGWVDTVLFASQGNNGQLAIAEVKVDVTGTLSAIGPNVTALLQLVVSSDPAGDPALNQPFYQIQSPSPDMILNEMLVLNIPFIVGTPTQFWVRAMARAMTSSQTSGGNNTSNVAFLNTVSWGGIERVTVGGNEVQYTAMGTESGIDWSQPFTTATVMPEPAALTLMGLGLVALAALRRRRTV